jgi:DNA-directed RNA polymerase subunit beta'
MVRDLLNFFEKPVNPSSFSAIQVSLSSPETVRNWSCGEVKKPETINYRTFKPEKDGLFCAKIFGPVKDYECLCGKYKRMKHRGIVCDKCGVEVIHSKVRRERLGHINLATPVAHIWFLKSLPSRIASILDMNLKDVESVIYSESYVLLEILSDDFKDEDKYKIGSILSENQLSELQEKYGVGVFRADTGGEAVYELLSGVRVEQDIEKVRKELLNTKSELMRKKLHKRLKVLESFNQIDDNGEYISEPKHMMLSVLPVLPPDLRPLVPLEGGRFATSDLNDLYRRVINRNNRLFKLKELNAPDIIIRNEKRMLQEAVDALFDNGRRKKVFTGPNKRPLRSLSDLLKGKQGRFRQNLLGKRVDYSGRSVVVAGPELKLHQCGLPKRMAIELYKPFLYNKLEEYGIVSTIKSAKKLVEKERQEVWDILEEVTKEHPILLNRAPTLHRLGIQAFEPVLIEGKAIQLHPLVCFAFNADFDGDQMAVHVPLSIEAQIEARVLMMSTNNILSPASGDPVIIPSQDIVLGIYYLTREKSDAKGSGKVFSSLEEVRVAYDHGIVDMNSSIVVYINHIKYNSTVGRVLLYEILPSEIDFKYVNKLMDKSALSKLIDIAFRKCGSKTTVLVADALRSIGYRYSTKSGISISLSDMIIPDSKKSLLDKAYLEVNKIKEQYSEGLLTEGERYNKVVDIWAKVTDNISDEMFKNISGKNNKKGINIDNSIFMMADSGARGSTQQIRQLAGMRGLMAKPSGEIIETPITANFREGLSVLQYFISTHGARKGLADTALKTASSGYLTRRLVDVGQDAIVSLYDCGTKDFITVVPLIENGEVKQSLGARVLGRVIAENLKSPLDESLILKRNEIIDDNIAELIDEYKFEKIQVRSTLVCEARRGVCAKCYGRDLASRKLINVGEAIGVIAAQSIGEPGTQLTMRTFHFGGAVSHKAEINTLDSVFSGKVKYHNLKVVVNRENKLVVLSRNGEIKILDDDTQDVKDSYSVEYGSILHVKEADKVKAGDRLAEWDSFSSIILAEKEGYIEYIDIQEGLSVEKRTDDITFLTHLVVSDLKKHSLKPTIALVDENGNTLLRENESLIRYSLPVGATISQENKSKVFTGDILAKIPRETTKTKDITGGLPRVAELFEARKPKDSAVLASCDGIVHFGEDSKGKRRIIIKDNDGHNHEFLINKSRYILVMDGDYVKRGDPLFDGPQNPHEILEVLGVKALSNYLVHEIQAVYRLQGVSINDKHIEVILRQMLKNVKVLKPGDTNYFAEEQVDKNELLEANKKVIDKSGTPATYKPILLGVTKASLSTESFISAASFQETTKVLTEASISGKIDRLRGLKENVIMGRLIPAGTGAENYNNLEISKEKEINYAN